MPLLAQAMNPLGLAVAIAGLIELVAEYAPQVMKLLGDLANVMNSLGSLIGQLLPLISQALGLITAIGTAMSSVLGGATGSEETPTNQDKPSSEDEDDESSAPHKEPHEVKV